MKPVVEVMTLEDMVVLAAYAASLPAEMGRYIEP